MRIGVDLGGTKIEVLALDDQGRELVRRRTPTPRHDYREIVTAIAGLVEAVEQEVGEAGTVGVGIPGAVSPATGLVKNANTTVLIGHPLDRDLADALGRPVRLENDANCFALSEAVDGAAAGQGVVFGLIIGTGAGSMVTSGLVRRGARFRLLRDNVVVAENLTVSSLKREKDDATEVREGYECGLTLTYSDIKVDDVIESYELQEKPRD